MKEKLFPWEKEKKGLGVRQADFRGNLGSGVNSDCRNYGCSRIGGLINDWSAICSLENWGEDAKTPNGLPDGDTRVYKKKFVTSEDAVWCDLEGRPYFDPGNFMQISGRGEFD